MKNITLTIIGLFFIQFITAQKIDNAKEKLQPVERTEHSSVSGSSYNDSETSFGNELAAEFAYIAFRALMTITWGALIETPSESESDFASYLSKKPYFNGIHGDYTYESSEAKNFRIDVKNTFLSDNNNIYGNRFQALIRPHQRFSIGIENTILHERLPFDRKDELILTTAMINYHRIRIKKLSLSWGAGATYVGSGINKTGFTIGANAELFVLKPVSFFTSYKSVFINGTSINIFDTGIKYHFKSLFLNASYNSYNFGGAHIPAAGLGIGTYF